MDAQIFWELLGGACEMGRFVAAVPNAAASANLVGKLELGHDGGERVLQRRKRPDCHVHFKPEAVERFAFVYLDPGFGPEPCIELRARGGQPVLRLYYQGKKATKRYDRFMQAHAAHESFIEGSWAVPAEEATEATGDEGIFVEAEAEASEDAQHVA